MKQKALYSLIGFAVLSCICVADDRIKLTNDKAKAHEIWDRVVNHGEDEALYNASGLAPSVAIPMLNDFVADSTTNPRRAAIATELLKKTQGYREYFQERLSKATSEGLVDESAFEVLSIIGTREAAFVVAPYLFDFTTTPAHGDIVPITTAVCATASLKQMKLDNRPTLQPSETPNADELIAWQQWAVDQGFVPPDWRQRVGKGEFLEKLRAVERQMALVSPPSSTADHNVASPSTNANSPISEIPLVKQNSSASEPKRTSSWLIVGVAIAVCLLLISMIAKRKSSNSNKP